MRPRTVRPPRASSPAPAALFLCTLAGQQVFADQAGRPREARRASVPVPPKVAAAERAAPAAASAADAASPAPAARREYWIRAEKVQLEHRPHRPRRR